MNSNASYCLHLYKMGDMYNNSRLIRGERFTLNGKCNIRELDICNYSCPVAIWTTSRRKSLRSCETISSAAITNINGKWYGIAWNHLIMSWN
jgi:hypothetical protein